MRQGLLLLLPCLLLTQAAPALAQYSYPAATYGYGYGGQAGAGGYATPVSPYSYYGYYGYYPGATGSNGYPVYNNGAGQAYRAPNGPGYPYLFNARSVPASGPRPYTPPSTAQAQPAPRASQPAASGSGTQPQILQPLPQGPSAPASQHRVFSGLPYAGAAPLAAAPPGIVDSDPTQAPLLIEDGGSCAAPCATPAPPPKSILPSNCFWVRGEYLLWRIRPGPLPGPLVTTGNPTQGDNAGVLGNPGTLVLFGGSPLNYGQVSGGRLTFGAWLNDRHTLGLEVSAFSLAQGVNNFAIASNATGNPGLYIPAINAVTGSESRLTVADPVNGFAGNVAIHSTSQLYGGEFNGLFNILIADGWRLDFLTGFRYLALNEHFDLSNTTKDLVFLTTTSINDHFQTLNNFYGSQVGLRLGKVGNRMLYEVTGKVAVGTTREMLDIAGNGVQTGPLASAPVGTFNSGFFAQGTNIGQHSQNVFSIVPQVQGRIGWLIHPNVALFAGYDFLYWNNVARVGNQLDRSLNLSQSPVFGTGTLVGPARPQPLINSSSFWAHGVSLGLEVHY